MYGVHSMIVLNEKQHDSH